MSLKASRIISLVLMATPSLMILISGVMKLTGSQQIVDGLGKAGSGNYIVLFGLIELAAVALLWIPKTPRRFFPFMFLSWRSSVHRISQWSTPISCHSTGLAVDRFPLKRPVLIFEACSCVIAGQFNIRSIKHEKANRNWD